MDILEINAVEAAKQTGVGRIVKISVPNASETGIAALQRLHGRSEAALGASDIAATAAAALTEEAMRGRSMTLPAPRR